MTTSHPKKLRLGDLDVYQIGNHPDAPFVILFHGYGANAFDLMPLSQVLLPNHKINWLFPDGRLSIDLGFGMTGKAWFEIDIVAMQEAMMRGEYRDLSEIQPPGFEQARQAGQEMLAALEVPSEKLVLGGFSQGAMLATDLSLRAQKAPAGLVILSGTLVDARALTKLAPKRAGLPFFQSHGTADPLLPFAAAEKLHAALSEAGLNGKLHAFHGGHEIPQAIIQKLDAFLEKLIS